MRRRTPLLWAALFALPNDSTRFRQTMKVLSTVHKDFTSPRYPLESTQFTFYVSPTISSRYLRYVTDTSSYSYGGSLKSFLSPTISISDGFTLIKDEDNQLVSDIYYYKDTSTDRTVIDSLGNPLASSYKTETEAHCQMQPHFRLVFVLAGFPHAFLRSWPGTSFLSTMPPSITKMS
jgi:predicted transcriptional regulator